MIRIALCFLVIMYVNVRETEALSCRLLKPGGDGYKKIRVSPGCNNCLNEGTPFHVRSRYIGKFNRVWGCGYLSSGLYVITTHWYASKKLRGALQWDFRPLKDDGGRIVSAGDMVSYTIPSEKEVNASFKNGLLSPWPFMGDRKQGRFIRVYYVKPDRWAAIGTVNIAETGGLSTINTIRGVEPLAEFIRSSVSTQALVSTAQSYILNSLMNEVEDRKGINSPGSVFMDVVSNFGVPLLIDAVQGNNLEVSAVKTTLKAKLHATGKKLGWSIDQISVLQGIADAYIDRLYKIMTFDYHHDRPLIDKPRNEWKRLGLTKIPWIMKKYRSAR